MIEIIKKYVFISYSHKDSLIAEKIYDKLNGSNIKVWLDNNNLMPATNFNIDIEKHIENCSLFLLLLTESSMKSDYVIRESNFAINNHIKILPVIIDNPEIQSGFKLLLNATHAIKIYNKDLNHELNKILRSVQYFIYGRSFQNNSIINEEELKKQIVFFENIIFKVKKNDERINEILNYPEIFIRNKEILDENLKKLKNSYEELDFLIEKQKEHIKELSQYYEFSIIQEKVGEEVLINVSKLYKLKDSYRNKCRIKYLKLMKVNEKDIIKNSFPNLIIKNWESPSNKKRINEQREFYDLLRFAKITLNNNFLELNNLQMFENFILKIDNQYLSSMKDLDKQKANLDHTFQKIQLIENKIDIEFSSLDNLIIFEEKVVNLVTIYKRTLLDFIKNYPNQKKKLSLLKYANLNKLDYLVNEKVNFKKESEKNSKMIFDLNGLKNKEEDIRSQILSCGTEAFNYNHFINLINTYKDTINRIKIKYNWNKNFKGLTGLNLYYQDNFEKLQNEVNKVDNIIKNKKIKNEYSKLNQYKEIDKQIYSLTRDFNFNDKERDHLSYLIDKQTKNIDNFESITSKKINNFKFNTVDQLKNILKDYDIRKKNVIKNASILVTKVNNLHTRVKIFLFNIDYIDSDIINDLKELKNYYYNNRDIVNYNYKILIYKNIDEVNKKIEEIYSEISRRRSNQFTKIKRNKYGKYR